MKYAITEVEIYPEYHLEPVAPDAPRSAGFEVSEELAARYQAALAEWKAVQILLGDILDPE